MKRVVGTDIHRTFAEVVFWEDARLQCHDQVDMTRSGLEGFTIAMEACASAHHWGQELQTAGARYG